MENLLQFAISGVLVGGLYSLIGMAVVLVYKSTHIVSFAHGEFLAFGAFFFWILVEVFGAPVWIGLIGALAGAGIIGLLTDRIAMRPLIGESEFTAFLMTFSVFMFLDGIYQLLLAGQARAYPPFFPQGVFGFGEVYVSQSLLICFAIAIATFVLLGFFFKHSKKGLGLRATAEDHRLAQSAGVSVKSIFTFVWALSAVTAAIGGIVNANVLGIYTTLPLIVFKGLVVAIFGGLDSLGGAMLAGCLLGFFENVGAGYIDPYVGGGIRDVAAYVMLLVILLIKPYGIFGLPRIERI